MPPGKSELTFTFFLIEWFFLSICKVNAKRTSSVDVVSASMHDGRQDVLFFSSDRAVLPFPQASFCSYIVTDMSM